ncbi:MAG: hypothetical protein AAGJ29_12545 [Pseudomonadota bacterium]
MFRVICFMPVAFALATIASDMAAAQKSNVALSFGGGTPGGVAEVKLRLNDYLKLRAGGNYLEFGFDITEDDIEYDGDVEFAGFTGAVDLHPFRNGFMLSGGVFAGNKAFDFEATSDEAVTIGDVEFTPAEYGQILGEAGWRDAAPFVGLGFDNTFVGDRRWGFSALAGAAFFGAGDVELMSVGGSLSDNPILVEQLAIEEANLEDEIDDFQVYPVVQLGVSVRF